MGIEKYVRVEQHIMEAIIVDNRELKARSDRRLAWIRTMNDRRVSMGLSCISCNLRPKSNYKDGYVDRHTSNCELAKEIK